MNGWRLRIATRGFGQRVGSFEAAFVPKGTSRQDSSASSEEEQSLRADDPLVYQEGRPVRRKTSRPGTSSKGEEGAPNQCGATANGMTR